METDYYQYHLDLTTNGEVVFPDQQAMIEFVAEFVADMYQNFIISAMVYNESDLNVFAWYVWRAMEEPGIIKRYAEVYLERKLYPIDTWFNRIKSRVCHESWPPEIRFDTDKHTQMYDFLLSRIGQGDTIREVFDNSYTYKIVEGTKLVRTTI